MPEANPYQTPEAPIALSTEPSTAVDEAGPKGLGGWLILVGIGIIFSPIRIIGMVLPIYAELFSNGSWQAVTTPGSDAYHPVWAPVIIAEIIINSLLAITWIYIAFLFFSKHHNFPRWYIGILLFTFAFILLDAAAIKLVLINEPMFDPDTVKELTRSAVAMLIWIPYMLVSKRVKATFVRY